MEIEDVNIIADLQRLEASDELKELEVACLSRRTETLTELGALRESKELLDLHQKLALRPGPTVFEILEKIEMLDRNREHLHSRLLEFFLRPDEKGHGLSDSFLKLVVGEAKFCRNCVSVDGPDPAGDLSDTAVKREAASEQGRADFKLRNERQRFVVLIENKILSGESHRQLAKYWEDAQKSDPDFAIGGIFLTLDGRPPKTAHEFDYVPVSYGRIAELLDKCIETSEVSDSCAVLVKQYASAVRRWFVDDPELKKLAWRIYRKYPQAADYLSSPEARPLEQIFQEIKMLVEHSPQLKVIYSSAWPTGTEVWFVPSDWESLPGLRHAETIEKKAEGRLLLMWVGYFPQHDRAHHRGVTLWLSSVPGSRPDYVNELVDSVQKIGLDSPRSLHTPMADDGWTHAWGRTLASEGDTKNTDRDQLFARIEESWQRFLEDDLPKIKLAVSNLILRRN